MAKPRTTARNRKADPGGRGNKVAKAGRVRKLRQDKPVLHADTTDRREQR